MLIHPQFDPIAISIGPLAVRWYGLMYLAGFVAFLWLGKRRAASQSWHATSAQDVDDLLFYGVLGVVLGGRLGQVLFYEPGYYLAHPLEILAVWQGGMAFHGGFLGVLLAMVWIAFVIWRHADPSVTGVYVWFYLVMGYAAVKLLGQTTPAAFGARVRVDVGERRNLAAALLVAAFTLATGMIFGGSLWGEADPTGEGEGGWWIPVTFFLLGWATRPQIGRAHV